MTDDEAVVWPVRLLRAASLLMLGSALLVWLAPLNVAGKNLQPFGCGSPASPMQGQLATFICSNELTGARYMSLGLLVSAGLLLVASELLAPRLRGRSALRGLAVVLPLALPVAALSAVALFSPVGSEGADGSLIRCGTALAPSPDPFIRRTCGHLPERQKTLAFGGLALFVFLVTAGVYVSSGGQRASDDESDHSSDPAVDPDASEPVLESRKTRRNPL